MGKQSRRKRGKGKPEQQSAPLKDSTLLERLRHADPRTRHAALAALSNTLLEPNSLCHSKRKINVDLLQAIRERVMDKDLECAQAAAGCLANYISFGAGRSQDDITASWAVVLTERLKECLENLKRVDDDDAVKKNFKLWWALTMQCLHTLCSLVEVNPEALDRLTKSRSVGLLICLLEVGAKHLERCKSSTSTEAPDSSCQEDAVTYAARTLHSALDDNEDLLKQCIEAQYGLNMVQACCKNETLPVACRLHCAGSLITARLLSGSEALQSVVISEAMPLLHSVLDFNVDAAFQLAQVYTDSYSKWKSEESDDALEQEVIRKVNERKEPARQIARRQKLEKKQFNKIDSEKDTEGVQADDDDDDMQRDDEGEKDAKQHNARENMENARAAWNRVLSPLELALEITANLTGLAPAMEETEYMDMDGEWGPDQEAMLATQEVEGGGGLSPLDSVLAQAIVSIQIPNRLTTLLKAICKPLPEAFLPDIKDGMEELQSKSGACLGNCVSEHFPITTSGLMEELRTALTASRGNPSIANAMTAALRSRSELRKQCQPSDLEVLLTLASSSPCQKEAIEMLGILCSLESHPEEVNRNVCSTLMAISSKKAAVLNEVLNSLMDIYGDDDCHPGIFESLKVLEYFQRTTPSFKRLIQCDRDDASEDEVEQWKETALNASRFVSYKKGQL